MISLFGEIPNFVTCVSIHELDGQADDCQAFHWQLYGQAHLRQGEAPSEDGQQTPD